MKRPIQVTDMSDDDGDVRAQLAALARRVKRLEHATKSAHGSVLAVACPWCGAEAGHVCREPSETATSPHKARVRAFYALRELQPLRGLVRDG